MFAHFVFALFGFCAREFPAKSETHQGHFFLTEPSVLPVIYHFYTGTSVCYLNYFQGLVSSSNTHSTYRCSIYMLLMNLFVTSNSL